VRSTLQTQLGSILPARLVDELLEGHAEAKRNFYLGGLRLSEVEGGRFCEAAFRLLQYVTTGHFTQIGRSLDTEKLIAELGRLPTAKYPDAIRIHIPRALRLVYDIRNKRDAAHLADGIDPNLQDATVVVSVLDWVLAEFLRLYHSVSADTAQALVAQIVTRAVPVIQEFDGFLKVLKPSLGASDHCLVLLYQCGVQGATFDQLLSWVRPQMRANLGRTLSRLVEGKDFVHQAGSTYKITYLGQKEVESRRLLEPTT